MARTAALTDPAIGRRIENFRRLRGWSVRKAAGLAGVDHRTWGRYEAGAISADNRVTLGKIAAALGRSRADLLGLPPEPATRAQAAGHADVHATTVAFIDADLRLPAPAPGPPLAQLHAELDVVRDLRQHCRYDAAAARLPALAHGLHAAADRAAPDWREATRGLVIAADAASFVVRYAGQTAAACMIAERGRQAAEVLEDPVMLGLAGWSQAHAATGCGLYSRALAIARQAAGEVEPYLDRPEAPEMYGQLLMIQGFALHALGDTSQALAAVAAAQEIAERTGDSDVLKLMFGPTNIRFWLISMHADGDDPGQAVELAGDTRPQAVASVSRQFAFYSDTARAITHAYPGGERDAQALRMLLAAERLAPQRMRSPLVLETVRGLIERGQRARGLVQLRALADRLGDLAVGVGGVG